MGGTHFIAAILVCWSIGFSRRGALQNFRNLSMQHLINSCLRQDGRHPIRRLQKDKEPALHTGLGFAVTRLLVAHRFRAVILGCCR